MDDEVSLGTFRGGCFGATVRQVDAACPDVLWGHHGAAWGVGGHDGCETFVYVASPSRVDDIPCHGSAVIDIAGSVYVIVLAGDCAGAGVALGSVAGQPVTCTQALWGVWTTHAGYGGYSGCHAVVYVVT